MNSGYYAAATGMVTQGIAMNHITSNISNSLMPGYKKQEVLFHSFDKELASEVAKKGPFAKPDLASGIDIIQGFTNFSQGAIKYTGDNGDTAIEGEGFYKVETPNGSLYMRGGKLLVNGNNELVTERGYKVLNASNAPIVFENAVPNVSRTFKIKDDGTVYFMDDSKSPFKQIDVGKIGMYKFASPEKLERVIDGLWLDSENQAGVVESDGKIRQGYLELSNVTAVESMVEMMLNQRLYDTNANMVKEIHTSLREYMNSIVS